MKKGTYLTILTVITVIAIILGSMYHIGGFFKKAGSFFGGRSNSGEKITETDDLDAERIDSLKISCGLMQINVDEGDKLSVDFDGDSRLKPVVKMSGGTLVIEQDEDVNASLSALKDESFLTITIPKDNELRELELDLGMGDVKLDNIMAKKVDIDAAMGNVKGDDIEAEDIDIDAAMGNVEFYDVAFKNLDANASMGNITVESVRDLSSYNIDADASLGNINIGGEKVSGNGEYHRKASSERVGSIDVDCDMGNIILSEK